jgi:hypothetical protein
MQTIYSVVTVHAKTSVDTLLTALFISPKAKTFFDLFHTLFFYRKIGGKVTKVCSKKTITPPKKKQKQNTLYEVQKFLHRGR